MNLYQCKKCNKMFWEDEMSPHRTYCKPCYNKMARDWRAINHEQCLEIGRRSQKKHKDKYNEYHRNWKLQEVEKVKAINTLNNAIAAGRVVRQSCEVCNTYPADAHHDDYSKPLAVRWLCRLHHAQKHSEIRRNIK